MGRLVKQQPHMPAVVLWRVAGDRKSNKIALLCFEQQAAKCRFTTSVKIDGGNVRQIVRPNQRRGQRKLPGSHTASRC